VKQDFTGQANGHLQQVQADLKLAKYRRKAEVFYQVIPF
jgi:hypothetical protein